MSKGDDQNHRPRSQPNKSPSNRPQSKSRDRKRRPKTEETEKSVDSAPHHVPKYMPRPATKPGIPPDSSVDQNTSNSRLEAAKNHRWGPHLRRSGEEVFPARHSRPNRAGHTKPQYVEKTQDDDAPNRIRYTDNDGKEIDKPLRYEDRKTQYGPRWTRQKKIMEERKRVEKLPRIHPDRTDYWDRVASELRRRDHELRFDMLARRIMYEKAPEDPLFVPRDYPEKNLDILKSELARFSMKKMEERKMEDLKLARDEAEASTKSSDDTPPLPISYLSDGTTESERERVMGKYNRKVDRRRDRRAIKENMKIMEAVKRRNKRREEAKNRTLDKTEEKKEEKSEQTFGDKWVKQHLSTLAPDGRRSHWTSFREKRGEREEQRRKEAAAKLEKEKLEREKRDKERLDRRLEKIKLEKERLERLKMEREKLEKEKLEKERKEKEQPIFSPVSASSTSQSSKSSSECGERSTYVDPVLRQLPSLPATVTMSPNEQQLQDKKEGKKAKSDSSSSSKSCSSCQRCERRRRKRRQKRNQKG